MRSQFLKVFIQNVRIDDDNRSARSSTVLHDTETIADTPGLAPLLICFNKLTKTTTTIKTIKNQSEVTRNVYLL